MRATKWSVGARTAMVVALAAAAPAPAQAPSLDGVTTLGAPVVGSPLQAVIAGTLDRSAVSYRWCHQRDGRADKCASGSPIGTSQTYVPSPGDIGHPLLVRAQAEIGTFTVEVVSAPTAPVSATPPTSTPPTTTPTPTGGGGSAPAFGTSGTSRAPAPAAAPTLFSYLNPFPVVRVRGFVAARGARISLLRVSAPRRATVKIRCVGEGCPINRRTRHAGRIRAFERFLPAGLRITVRVTRPERVGKYVRLLIRARKPPSRHDACLLPGSNRAASCPPR